MLPTWDLSDLYQGPQDATLENDLNIIEKDAIDFARVFKGNMNNAKDIFDSLKQYEALQNKIQKVAVYARLLSFINLDKPEIQGFYQSVMERITTAEQALVFYTLALNAISDEELNTYFEAVAELAFYKPMFRRLRAFLPHQLDEKIEQVFNDKAITSTQMWQRLFDETLSKLKFIYEGEELGIAAISDLLSNSQFEVRQAAANCIQKTLKESGDLFVCITNVLAKDLAISDQWRHFKNLGDSRHLSNDVEAEVVNNLVETVKQNYKNLSHRFYALKARLLNKEKLFYCDRNAPLPFSDDTTYTFEEAKQIVLAAYGAFDGRIKEQVQRFFDSPWIDAPVSASKYSGAFNMPTFQGHHPYILLNFKGKLRDIATLAHELGHGIHSLLADNLGIFMSNAPLTLCETASVFGEMLTFQYLLKQAKDKKAVVVALEGKLSDMINTVVRQIAFFDFEYRIHMHRRTNGELTRAQINAIWLSVQQESLGPSVIVDETIEEFWMTIPHFIHSPFYVYAYAFGDCLVNSLYQYYCDHPDGFADKYIDLLKAGGSKHHKELLKPFNLDASCKDFWQNGLKVITNLLDELENMMNIGFD